MLLFLMKTFPLWWTLLALVVLRSFRSAAKHDEEFESSADAQQPSLDRPGSWRQCTHNVMSGSHAA